MTKLIFIKTIFLISGIGLLSCSKPANEPSFYFWRTTATLSQKEKETLKENNIKTLYVRFFDVDLDPLTQQLKPVGVLDSIESLSLSDTIIPVVYITNRTFLNMSDSSAITLARHIVKKVNGIYAHYKELQIDCDWSHKTKSVYFRFLKAVKQQSGFGKKITATIRLHQIKYQLKTGVPPVDGGMLMFYNMGNLHQEEGPNSIFDLATAKKYTSYLAQYQLHLDVALPIFSWFIHYRNGSVIAIHSKRRMPTIVDTNFFSANKNKLIFKVKKNGLTEGVYYKTNDVLKYESPSDDELFEAVKLLKKNLAPANRRIVLFDLDDINLNNHEKKTIKTIFSSFNQ